MGCELVFCGDSAEVDEPRTVDCLKVRSESNADPRVGWAALLAEK